jgi:Holliday junction DNA helicase RuvA
VIGRLRGTLVERADDVVTIDCAGVGYVVTVSIHTLAGLPALGEELTLRIYTQVMETRIALYGFGSAAERELFDLLITVKNVGPSSAMGILSGGPDAVGIAQMIAAQDVGGLIKLRGVGKKTAEMLVVELHDKCALLLASWGAAGKVAAAAPAPEGRLRVVRSARAPILTDVHSALTQLGWRPAEVERVVSGLEVPEGATLEALLRQALRAMPR